MIGWLKVFFKTVHSSLLGRHNLILEILALRQQLMVLERQSKKPRFTEADRMRAFQFTWNWEAIYGYLGNLNASTHREREEFCQNIRWLFGLKKAF